MSNVIDRCEKCGQSVQRWDRKLNKSMAEGLVLMYHKGKYNFHHTPSLHTSHELAQLRWWDLTQPKPGSRPDGGAAGWYRLTSRGRSFVEGKTTVPFYCLAPKFGESLELSGPEVDIDYCLGESFDLQELLGRVVPKRKR